MENLDESLKKLSRAERIREEAKRAQEFGQTPKRPLSLHPNFRVEGLTAASRPQCSADSAPGEQFLKLSRVKIGSSRSSNWLVPKESPGYFKEQIESELKRAHDPQNASKLLELLSGLTNVDPRSQATDSLRRRVLNQVFGQSYFQSERDLPKERGPRGVGNSLFTSKEKEV
jgi:hypothetical protein